MPFPVVWTERGEAKWKDCTYSSGLQALVYGGFTAFPAGTYTMAEREALERSDDQPDETGASLDDLVTAVKRRYGLTLVKRTAGTLALTVTRDEEAIVLQGLMGNLPKGHRLRRWDPDFEGGHAITVISMPGDRFVWLDPLATAKYPGDVVGRDEVITFAKSMGQHIVVKANEFKPCADPAVLDAALARAIKAEAEAGALRTALVAANAKIANAKTALG